MGLKITITSIILAGFTVIPHGQAQDIDDISSYIGYRGYTAYQNKYSDGDTQHAQRLTMPANAPQPITDIFLYNALHNETTLNQGLVEQRRKIEPTRIEEFYRERTGDETLSQHGYDLFYNSNNQNNNNHLSHFPSGAVQDSYLVQAGDRLHIVVTGEQASQKTYQVTSDGRLFIESLPAINAMGRSLGDLRTQIQQMAAQAELYGDIDVSLATVRQIIVTVAGHVERPGQVPLSAFHSVIDALNKAGGIKKSGSLRQVNLIRNNAVQYIDLYQYLSANNLQNINISLQDGDKIIVAPLGDTIAVTGDVKQAGIYELPTFNQPLSQQDILKLSGGGLSAGDHNITVTKDNGAVTTLGKNKRMSIPNGAIIDVNRIADRLDKAIERTGYSRQNGYYSLKDKPTLADLLDDGALLGDEIYPLIGIVSRMNREKLVSETLTFSPQDIVKNKNNLTLQGGDKITLFSQEDIQDIMRHEVEDDDIPEDIIKIVKDNLVTVAGAVNQAGDWPVSVNVDLETLIAVAGGLKSQATLQNIEITSKNSLSSTHERRVIDTAIAPLDSVFLAAGDTVRINAAHDKILDKKVRISGEVINPGEYQLMRGDTLLTLIERAGGLTSQAYPPAAVFSRKAERRREEQKFQNAAQALEQNIALREEDKGGDMRLTRSQITMARQLSDELRTTRALGRVMVEADPALLSLHPEMNMLLDDGDHLHIPKRTLSVRVSGEVMNPASLLFNDNFDPQDYIRQAGGTTYYADRKRSFVVYPDGSAHPIGRSSWNNSSQAMIIPGSTIIVPRDPKPFDFMDSFKDITQILSNMAITGVFIEDIATDEN